MWVAQYDISVDGFRAKRIADQDLRDWHIILSDTAGQKLSKIDYLPAATYYYARPAAELEKAIDAYSKAD